MKINESTLVTYATSQACPTDKEGWLWKRGEVNKNDDFSHVTKIFTGLKIRKKNSVWQRFVSILQQ